MNPKSIYSVSLLNSSHTSPAVSWDISSWIFQTQYVSNRAQISLQILPSSWLSYHCLWPHYPLSHPGLLTSLTPYSQCIDNFLLHIPLSPLVQALITSHLSYCKILLFYVTSYLHVISSIIMWAPRRQRLLFVFLLFFFDNTREHLNAWHMVII